MFKWIDEGKQKRKKREGENDRVLQRHTMSINTD